MVAFVNTSLNDPGCTGQTGLVALTRGAAGVAAGVATTAGVVRVAGACVRTRADAGGAGGDGRAVMFEAVDAAAEAVTFAATEGVVVAAPVDRAEPAVAAGVETVLATGDEVLREADAPGDDPVVEDAGDEVLVGAVVATEDAAPVVAVEVGAAGMDVFAVVLDGGATDVAAGLAGGVDATTAAGIAKGVPTETGPAVIEMPRDIGGVDEDGTAGGAGVEVGAAAGVVVTGGFKAGVEAATAGALEEAVFAAGIVTVVAEGAVDLEGDVPIVGHVMMVELAAFAAVETGTTVSAGALDVRLFGSRVGDVTGALATMVTGPKVRRTFLSITLFSDIGCDFRIAVVPASTETRFSSRY